VADRVLDYSLRPLAKLSTHLSAGRDEQHPYPQPGKRKVQRARAGAPQVGLFGMWEQGMSGGGGGGGLYGADMVHDLRLMEMAHEVVVGALVEPMEHLWGLGLGGSSAVTHKGGGTGGAFSTSAPPTRCSDYCSGFGEISSEHRTFLRRLRRYAQDTHAYPFLAVTSCVAHGECTAVSRLPADIAEHIWRQQLLGRGGSARASSRGSALGGSVWLAWTGAAAGAMAAPGFYSAGASADLPPALASRRPKCVAEVLRAAGVAPRVTVTGAQQTLVRGICSNTCSQRQQQRQRQRRRAAAAAALLKDIRSGLDTPAGGAAPGRGRRSVLK